MIDRTEVVNGETRIEDDGRPRELSAEELRFSTKIGHHFGSTRELAGAKDFVGQERALASLELGIGIAGSGYNIFVSGLTGADKLLTLRRGSPNGPLARRLQATGVCAGSKKRRQQCRREALERIGGRPERIRRAREKWRD